MLSLVKNNQDSVCSKAENQSFQGFNPDFKNNFCDAFTARSLANSFLSANWSAEYTSL